MDEDTLNRMAEEALLAEARIGARRSAVTGPSGWIKKKDTINKRFLHSIIRNAVQSNKHKTLNCKKKEINSPNRTSEDK